MDEIQELLHEISRSVTLFTTGGFRPTHTIEESWIGKVNCYGVDEEIPLDEHGALMLPIAQFYLPSLPFIPEAVKDTQIVTVFASAKLADPLEPMGANWLIREYKALEDIQIKELSHAHSFLKAFPLQPAYAADDCPLWDGGGLTAAQEARVIALEEKGVIDSYYDITQHHYQTKFGGYPSYCQSGIGISGDDLFYLPLEVEGVAVHEPQGYGEGFEFVFQISSDEKAGLNVVDSGSLMFAKNKQTKQWSMYYDFY
ncbi:hypothetical protein [Myroides pelagicus]|uniref:DUF1963 domain-containing protein n=1 Tax=Myroides pelagicus TaxID=270914 RepID=A0A7K1GK34_9FLAO|nr:hypothetical protein [Myroides pelagicus]MTH29221.1 hypothetical protein [Myroides pelagicus]